MTDPKKLEQVDAFLINLLDSVEDFVVSYLDYMLKWISDPKMEEYLVIRANWIIIKI